MAPWYEVKPKRVLLAVGFVVALGGVLFLAFTGTVKSKTEYKPPPPRAKKVSLEGFDVRGPALGEGEEVILISSPSCPACRAFVPKILQELKGHSLYYKHVRYGKGGDELERAMECVREKREELFWDFLKLCYSRPALALTWLSDKTSSDFVKTCLTDRAVEAALNRDDEQVRRIGVSAIPAVIVGDELYQGGVAIKRVLLEGEKGD